MILDTEKLSFETQKDRCAALRQRIVSELKTRISDPTLVSWRKEILDGNETFWKGRKALQNRGISKGNLEQCSVTGTLDQILPGNNADSNANKVKRPKLLGRRMNEQPISSQKTVTTGFGEGLDVEKVEKIPTEIKKDPPKSVQELS